jgi:hypothetical protein
MDRNERSMETKTEEKVNKKELVRRWIKRIEESESVRKQFESDWKENYKSVYGEDWMQDGKRESSGDTGTSKSKKYQYDILLTYLKTEIPSLVLYRPEIFLTATEQAAKENPQTAEQSAKAYQSEVNQIFNNMDGFEFEIKSCLADAHCSFAVMKISATPVFEPHPDAGKLLDIDMTTGEPIIAPDEQLKEFKFDVNRVDPFKFLIDKRCKNDPNKAHWMGEEIDRTLEELTDSGLYKQDILNKLRDRIDTKDKEDWEVDVTIYEIYDREEEKIIVICKDFTDDFLRFDDTPEGIHKDPYSILKLCEIPGQFIPKPDISSGRQLQEDHRSIREWMKKQANKSIPKKGVKGALAENEEELKKLTDGISDYVKCNQNDVFDINSDLKLGSSVGDFLQVVGKDFDETMSQPSQDRGITGVAKFATEAQIAEQQGNLRERDKLETVKMWISTIIEKLIFQVKNSGFADLQKLPIDVDLNIEIDIESKTPKSKALDRKQLNEMLTLIAQNPIYMQSPTLMDQLFRDYDIREKDKIIAELQQASQASQAAQNQPVTPQKPLLNLSLALKQELLPIPAVDKIVDIIMNTDIPIMPNNQSTSGNGNTQIPGSGEPVGAGLGGIEPGNGQQTGGL